MLIKPLRTSLKPSQRTLFLRAGRLFHPKKREKPSKTPPAVTYRGIIRQKNFTGKEADPETGLYYYGARYLDPKTSRWISGDPALGDYLPVAPLGDEEKKRNANLPGQGGVFNYVNMHAYHYAGNNPVKYVDPDGRDSILLNKEVDNFIGIEHMGGFIQDENKDWWFFYWGTDVKYERVEDASIFEDMDKMNAYLFSKGYNPNAEKKPYRDAVYIEGDFVEAHIAAIKLRDEYIASLESWNGRGLSNRKYRFFTRNCGHETMRLFVMGVLPNGTNVGDYMNSHGFKINLIPNLNMNNMQKLFGNKSINFHSFTPFEKSRRSRH